MSLKSETLLFLGLRTERQTNKANANRPKRKRTTSQQLALFFVWKFKLIWLVFPPQALAHCQTAGPFDGQNNYNSVAVIMSLINGFLVTIFYHISCRYMTIESIVNIPILWWIPHHIQCLNGHHLLYNNMGLKR